MVHLNKLGGQHGAQLIDSRNYRNIFLNTTSDQSRVRDPKDEYLQLNYKTNYFIDIADGKIYKKKTGKFEKRKYCCKNMIK